MNRINILTPRTRHKIQQYAPGVLSHNKQHAASFATLTGSKNELTGKP